HINMNLASENVEALTRETIDTMTPREMEVQDRQGKWYALRIRPYKSTDNRIDGAVLTLTDIEAVKRYQSQIERSRDHLLGAVALMREPVVVVDDDMRVKAVNDAFCRAFDVEAGGAEGVPLFELDDKRWGGPKLRSALDQIRTSDGGVRDIVIDYEVGSNGRRRMKLNGRRFSLETSRLTVLTLEDVPDGKARS